jgi:hypothetical protein
MEFPSSYASMEAWTGIGNGLHCGDENLGENPSYWSYGVYILSSLLTGREIVHQLAIYG